MALRTNFTPSGEPGGGRLTGTWYGIDAIEHATQVNTNTADIASNVAKLAAAKNIFTGKMEINGIGSGPPFGYDTTLWIAPQTRTNPPIDTQAIYAQHRAAGNLHGSVNDAVIAELRLWDVTNSGPGQQALEASLVVTDGTGIPNNIGNMNAVTANFHTEGAAIGTAANVSMLRGQQIPALAAGFSIGTACSLTLEEQVVGTANYTLYAPAGKSLLGPTQVGDLTIVDPGFTSNGNIRDSSGNKLLVLGKGSATAVNYIQINNAGAGQYPTLYSQGSDTNVDFVFWPQGAGLVRVVNGLRMDGDATIKSGTGSPAGVVAAPVGSIFLRTDGGAATTLYVKESGGSGNTGWVAK